MSTPQHQRPDEAWERELLTGVSASASPETSHGEAREANLMVTDVVTKLAVLTVRRQCNQHSCELPSTGVCGHEDARRDADYLRHVLDVLGLPGDLLEVTEADRANLLTAMAHRSTTDVDRLTDYVSDGD